MKKLHICLAFVLVFIMLFGMMSVAAAVGEDAEFTISLVPVGSKTELNADIVDAEIGGTATVDLMLINNEDSDKEISAFGVDIVFDEGLTFKSIEWFIEGFPSAETRPSRPDKVRLSFFTGGDENIIAVAARGSVKLCTLTFDVSDTGLAYGEQIGVIVEDNSFLSISLTNMIDEFVPSLLIGALEIVTDSDTTGVNQSGEDDSGDATAAETPAQDGAANTETGLATGESSGEDPKESVNATQSGSEAPSETGSVLGRTGTMAIIIAAILVIIAAAVLISRKKKS